MLTYSGSAVRLSGQRRPADALTARSTDGVRIFVKPFEVDGLGPLRMKVSARTMPASEREDCLSSPLSPAALPESQPKCCPPIPHPDGRPKTWTRAWFDMGLPEAPVNIAEDFSGLAGEPSLQRMSEHARPHPLNAHGCTRGPVGLRSDLTARRSRRRRSDIRALFNLMTFDGRRRPKCRNSMRSAHCVSRRTLPRPPRPVTLRLYVHGLDRLRFQC